MAYKKIKASEAPKRKRKALSRFETTAEWAMMKRDIDKGLNPSEALQVILSTEDREKYGIHNRRAVARFIQKYLLAHKLPYTVRSFERRETGDFFVLVQHARSK
jgi:hypothetical protein